MVAVIENNWIYTKKDKKQTDEIIVSVNMTLKHGEHAEG